MTISFRQRAYSPQAHRQHEVVSLRAFVQILRCLVVGDDVVLSLLVLVMW